MKITFNLLIMWVGIFIGWTFCIIGWAIGAEQNNQVIIDIGTWGIYSGIAFAFIGAFLIKKPDWMLVGESGLS